MKSFRRGYLTGIGLLVITFAPSRGDDVIDPSSSPFRTLQKLKTIFVSVDFKNANLEEAVQALAVLSKKSDPNHTGIGFVIQPEAPVVAKPITLKLDNVPVGVALRYVCDLGYVKYHFVDRLVSISPEWSGGCGIDRRTFHVDPSFVGLSSNSGENLPKTP